jgi:hypothetical protein
MTKANQAVFSTETDTWNQEGLTKREYFAAIAMQGILSNQGMIDTEEWICRNSVRMADALITALNENQ